MSLPPCAELVGVALQATDGMGALSLDERLACAARAGERLQAAGEQIVDSAVRELGQPRRFARQELRAALAHVAALPALAAAIRPRPLEAAAGSTTLEWRPYGVAFAWHAANSPVWVPTAACLQALVAGNACLARPSRRAAATTGMVLEAIGAPWPEGALTPVRRPPEEAEALVWADGVDVVIAHGSTATCKRHLAGLGAAYARGAALRPYIAEGSGNDPFVVLEGADLDLAARAAALAAFANSGQLCMAAKRLVVAEAVWEAFRPRLRAAVEALVLGDPAHESTDVAPLSEGRARAHARAALAEALALGGRIVVGEGERGPFFTPTVVELPREATATMLWREESFAPVRALVLARDAKEALALANDTPYGLGAAVFGPAEALVDGLRAARVVIDESPLYEDAHLSVGGVGESGFAGARPKLEQLVYARRVHRGER